jgi:hypothetical protein
MFVEYEFWALCLSLIEGELICFNESFWLFDEQILIYIVYYTGFNDQVN